MGRGLLLWLVRARAMRTSAPILCCGVRGDVRLGERGNASVTSFCCWIRQWQAVADADADVDAALEGDEVRDHW